MANEVIEEMYAFLEKALKPMDYTPTKKNKIEEIMEIYAELTIEERQVLMDEISEFCNECNGTGKVQVMSCRNNSNECCGGCFVDETCECRL